RGFALTVDLCNARAQGLYGSLDILDIEWRASHDYCAQPRKRDGVFPYIFYEPIDHCRCCKEADVMVLLQQPAGFRGVESAARWHQLEGSLEEKRHAVQATAM